MESTTIIICTEKGVLENMSKILITSIRKFGGVFSNCPIYSFQPRKAQKVSQQTKRFFEDNQVEFIDLELNKKYAYYPLANKQMVCAWAERNLNSEILVFLDSDVVVFDEPKEFLVVKKNEVRVNPVALKGIGSNGQNDGNSTYWESLYKKVGVKTKKYIKTLVDKELILEYWNTGHISTRRENGLFNEWNKNLQDVLSQKLIPSNGLFFAEQATFAATVSSLELEVRPFGKKYNYHLLKRSKIINPIEIVSLHYHDIFEKGEIPNQLKKSISRTKNDWLDLMLNEYDIMVPYFKRKMNLFSMYKNNWIFSLK